MRRSIPYFLMITLLATFTFIPSTISSAFTKSTMTTGDQHESETGILGIDTPKQLSVNVDNTHQSNENISYDVLYFSDAPLPAAVSVVPKYITSGLVAPGQKESFVFQGNSGDYILRLSCLKSGCHATGSISYSSLSPISYLHDLCYFLR